MFVDNQHEDGNNGRCPFSAPMDGHNCPTDTEPHIVLSMITKCWDQAGMRYDP